MIRAYIATRLENHARHNAVRDALAAAGVGLTYDWSTHGPVWRDGVLRIRKVAVNDMDGVRDAGIVVVILPGGRGTHAELGAALALGKPVYVLAEDDATKRMRAAVPEACAFYHHPLVSWIWSVDDLLAYVRLEMRNDSREPDTP